MTDQLQDYYNEKRPVIIIQARKWGRLLEILRNEFSVIESTDEENGEELLIVRNKKSLTN